MMKNKIDNAEYVDAIGCTGLTSLEAPNAKTVDASGCTGLTSLEAPNAEYVYAIGCTGLTSLEAPNAKTVYARGCTGLTSLEAPNAEYVYARDCTGLTSLEAPNAKTVDASGCTGFVSQWKRDKLIPLLTATEKTIPELLETGCWECHEWSNCPMHAVFGAMSIDDVPRQWRTDAAIFVSLFDAGEIERPAA